MKNALRQILPWALAFQAGVAFCEGDPVMGKALFEEGILATGEPLAGTVFGGIQLHGEFVACAKCHRRSGYGGIEGTVVVPPITSTYLFEDLSPARADHFRTLYKESLPPDARALVAARNQRIAYTSDSLAQVLKTGDDPTGRTLIQNMPRYHLTADDHSNLISYLRTLGAANQPGVDNKFIHFGFVCQPGVAPEKKTAILSVMEAFIQRHNSSVQQWQIRPGHSRNYKDRLYESRREWKLHQCLLTGGSDTWGDQLDKFVQRQAVFALMGGAGDGAWEPIDQFCEIRQIPCLFPNTDFPNTTGKNRQTLYFSKGFALEIEALIQHLSDRPRPRPRITILSPAEECPNTPIHFLSQQLAAEGYTFTELPLGAEVGSADCVVVCAPWKSINTETLQSLASASRDVILLGGYVFRDEKEMPGSDLAKLSARLLTTWRWSTNEDSIPRTYRSRAWMRARGIEPGFERLKQNTWFAMSVAEHALNRMDDHFSREYLLERVEHETERALNPGSYAHLSLGPGQRFASKKAGVMSISKIVPKAR